MECQKNRYIPSEVSVKKIKEPNVCDRCHATYLEFWLYTYPDGDHKKFCRFCKWVATSEGRRKKIAKKRLTKSGKRKRGGSDALSKSVPGCAYGGKRQR